ncbi:MAG: NAD(+)/NADH kinase [Oscillospiraceae bacterium]|nr:NAD(+)/NADH kinase [Oscillospiraceae bacterium]
MKILVCKNKKKPDEGVVCEVLKRLRKLGHTVEFSEAVHENCDMIITVGGDGTILHHGKNAAKLNKPLLGINTGRLGFMTSLEADALDDLRLLSDEENYSISTRMMFDVSVNGEFFLALNDAVFQKSLNAKLPEFKVSADGNTVTEIRADGLILSTPTGSTAYALSAGGPIIEPRLDCIEFTPICAHSLFGRPMIFSAELKLKVEFDRKVFISIDGEKAIELQKEQSAIIKKSALKLSLIDLKSGSFYCAVREKLMRPLK